MTERLYRSRLLMSAEQSVVLLVDAQDKLLELVPDAKTLRWNLSRLIQGAQVLGVPRLATEQYPEKLGPTSPALTAYFGDDANRTASTRPIPAKLCFSCAGSELLVEQLVELQRRQILLAGVETHVCVLQTALDLVAAGYDVYLAADAVGARYPIDHHTALRRMELAGVTLLTTEAALFEWCEQAGTPQFKRISQIVRSEPE
jgi:nicotinamidase-related amidase